MLPRKAASLGPIVAIGPFFTRDRSLVSELAFFGTNNAGSGRLESSRLPEVRVTLEECERMEELFKSIAIENDPEKFEGLLKKLNELLETKHQRIHQEAQQK